ncbi:MAG: iron-containing redox enzyme family protein [Patescibacteria group bacterium]|jgi:pyrroloquinoline quinone (PQQ) biosynthesis protein C
MNRDEEMKQALEPFCMRTHPGLRKILEEGMSLPIAQKIARGYGPCNAASLQIMGAGLSKVWDPDLYYPLVENIYDEVGRGNREDSHVAMFERFMRAVDVDPRRCTAEPGSPSERTINAFLAVSNEPTEYEALALMHGFEAVFPYICGGIYTGLLKSRIVSEDEAFFFDHHSKVDIEHSGIMLKTMKKPADTTEKWQKCIDRSVHGARTLYDLFDPILS